MRLRSLVAGLTVVAMTGAACGDGDNGGAGLPSSTDAASTSSASTTTGLPPTTATPPVTTTSRPPVTTLPPSEVTNILRVDGIGPADFGTPAGEAVTALTDILGPPDFDRTGGPDDCEFMVEQTRAIGWNSLGLRVLLTDWGGEDQPALPMHLATWDAAPWDGVTNDPRITTKGGLGVGSTSVRLRAIYPDARLTIAEATMWFVVERATGRIRGAFDWSIMPMGELGPEFFRPLQAALNAHGADLVVDGLFGPRTAQALTAFATSHGIEDEIVDAAGRIVNWDPLLDAAWRLGLPPDDVRVLAMSAGDGGRCE